MNSNDKFKDDGYIIYKNLISEKLIDDFFKIFYSDFINSTESYPQMNNQEWGKVDISKNGFYIPSGLGITNKEIKFVIKEVSKILA